MEKSAKETTDTYVLPIQCRTPLAEERTTLGHLLLDFHTSCVAISSGDQHGSSQDINIYMACAPQPD